MESLIDSGESWMEPLLNFRDMLASTQDPKVKHQFRDYKRRNGKVTLSPDGKLIPGPYRPKYRKEFLRKLLEVQKQIQKNGPDPEGELITKDELEEIRRIWRVEIQDWEDSIPTIYREVMGEDLDWDAYEQPGFSADERHVLDSLCAQEEVPSKLVAKLLDIERSFHGMSRRTAVYQKLGSVLDEDWRSEEEVLDGLVKIQQ